MANTNRQRSTLKYQPGGPPYIPEKDRDQYFPEDFIIDMNYQDGKQGDRWGNFLTAVPSIQAGSGLVERVSNTQIDISALFAWTKDDKNIVRDVYSDYSGLINPTLGGDGQYYVKVAYSEDDFGVTRLKVYDPVSYYAYVIDGLTITIDQVSPLVGELCLGGFVVVGGLIVSDNLLGRSPHAKFNYADFPPPNESILLEHLESSLQATAQANKVTNYRGVYQPILSVDVLNRRKGQFFVETRQLSETDGTDLTPVKQEQVNAVSRLDNSRLTGAFQKGLLTTLSESAIERENFTVSSTLNNAGHHYRVGFKCAVVGSGFLNLRVDVHDSFDALLGSVLIPFVDLLAGEWFYGDINIPGLAVSTMYHYHIYVDDVSYVSQPFLYCATVTPEDLLFKQYHKPSGGIYRNANVVNFLNEAGSSIVPVRGPGDDIVIGSPPIPPDERTQTGGFFDILPIDLSNVGVWDTFEYYDYILLDPVSGRVKFPPGFDVRDYYVEYNVKVSLIETDAQTFLRHQKAESVDRSIGILEENYVGLRIPVIAEDDLTPITTGIVDNSQAVIFPNDPANPGGEFTFKARDPGVDKFRDIVFQLDYVMGAADTGLVRIQMEIFVEGGSLGVSSQDIDVPNDTSRASIVLANIILSAEDFSRGDNIRVLIERDNGIGLNHTGDFVLFNLTVV